MELTQGGDEELPNWGSSSRCWGWGGGQLPGEGDGGLPPDVVEGDQAPLVGMDVQPGAKQGPEQ